MAEVDARPHPPGRYDVVVVGSGPGGLQTSYYLSHYGVPHALISADDAPGGMFRSFPVFDRLISWTKPDAPVEKGTREYEAYDHNSLLAEDPALSALVPRYMDRAFDVPARAEMESGLQAFADRAGVRVRYGCRWEATRRDDDGFVLSTTDGEYGCKAAVFALGVTEPWNGGIAGADEAPHYVETKKPAAYQGKRIVIVGKRNSGFELANGLLPVGERDHARLAAAGPVRRARPLASARPLPPALRGVRARRLGRARGGRGDRADRAPGGRLPRSHAGHDLAGRAQLRGRRGDRRDRLRHPAR